MEDDEKTEEEPKEDSETVNETADTTKTENQDTESHTSEQPPSVSAPAKSGDHSVDIDKNSEKDSAVLERDRAVSTPVKSTKPAELQERERSKSSPKTLRELSKELSSSDVNEVAGTPNGTVVEDVDEGVDMQGIYFLINVC